MRAGGGQRNQCVAGAHLGAVDDVGLLDHADAEAGQVVVFTFVHAGHLGGFAAHQGAASLLAASTNAGDHLRCDVDIELAGGVVVQEEQRLGATDDQIVDAHGDQVDADAVVHAQIHCQTQLGANAVSA